MSSTIKILDSRDLRERLCELTNLKSDFLKRRSNGRTKDARLDAWYNEYGQEDDELEALTTLKETVYGWDDGVQLIKEGDFEEFAKQYAEDIGAIEDANEWPASHIDWSCAAESLKMDYSTVNFMGETYLYRS